MTLIAAGESGVPNFMTIFPQGAHILCSERWRIDRAARLSLAHNICMLAAIVIALAVRGAIVKSVGLPPS